MMAAEPVVSRVKRESEDFSAMIPLCRLSSVLVESIVY